LLEQSPFFIVADTIT